MTEDERGMMTRARARAPRVTKPARMPTARRGGSELPLLRRRWHTQLAPAAAPQPQAPTRCDAPRWQQAASVASAAAAPLLSVSLARHVPARAPRASVRRRLSTQLPSLRSSWRRSRRRTARALPAAALRLRQRSPRPLPATASAAPASPQRATAAASAQPPGCPRVRVKQRLAPLQPLRPGFVGCLRAMATAAAPPPPACARAARA